MEITYRVCKEVHPDNSRAFYAAIYYDGQFSGNRSNKGLSQGNAHKEGARIVEGLVDSYNRQGIKAINAGFMA